MKSLNRILPFMTLVGLALFLSACNPSQLSGGALHQMSGSGSLEADLPSSIYPSAGNPTNPITTAGPTPADPPPQTLGSYPWLMIIEYKISADRQTVEVRALVLDENDPPGLPVFFGYLKNTDDLPETRNLRIPIIVEDRVAGLVSFTIPYRWFVSNKTVGVMTGPFYTNASFPLCDFDQDDLEHVDDKYLLGF